MDLSLYQSGENRKELEMALDHYQSDKLKLQAAKFLISNMYLHFHREVKFTRQNNKTVDFNVFEFESGELISKAIDSIRNIPGIKFRNEIISDTQSISSEELIDHIDLAFEVWKNKSWASHLSFDQFCEFILPYRAYREPIESWRDDLSQRYSWLNDSIGKIGNDPVEVCTIVNNELRSWLKFDWDRGSKTLHDQGISEILQNKHGKCVDLVVMATCAMRAQGIPVAIDEAPHWAHRAYGHTWNVVLNKDGVCIPFGGAEKNPGEHDAILSYVKVGKIFRNCFARQPGNLLEQVDDVQNVPPLFYRVNLKDVTQEYVDVGNILLNDLKLKTDPDDEVAYICIYNGGQWRPIYWSSLDGNNAEFKNMDKNNVLYLPATYSNGRVNPVGKPFVYTKSEEIETIQNAGRYYKEVILKYNNKMFDETLRDGSVRDYPIKKDYRYRLAYWDDKWVYLNSQTADTSYLICKNVPKGTLYKLEYLDYGNTGQRPFILNNGEQEFL